MLIILTAVQMGIVFPEITHAAGPDYKPGDQVIVEKQPYQGEFYYVPGVVKSVQGASLVVDTNGPLFPGYKLGEVLECYKPSQLSAPNILGTCSEKHDGSKICFGDYVLRSRDNKLMLVMGIFPNGDIAVGTHWPGALDNWFGHYDEIIHRDSPNQYVSTGVGALLKKPVSWDGEMAAIQLSPGEERSTDTREKMRIVPVPTQGSADPVSVTAFRGSI